MAVTIQVNEPQAVVAALFVNHRQAARQREGKLLPRFIGVRPGEDGVLFRIG